MKHMQVQPAAGWGITTLYVLTLSRQKRDRGCLIKLCFVLKVVNCRTILLPGIKENTVQLAGARTIASVEELLPGLIKPYFQKCFRSPSSLTELYSKRIRYVGKDAASH